MPGAGTYIVGGKTGYQTIQDALDQLWADQGATAFSATQTIIVYPVETLSKNQVPGVVSYDKKNRFAGARVPSGLNPTSTYRLVIRSGVENTAPESDRPILYGRVGSDFEWCGIYVDGVDYVDILDLDIREFKSSIIYYQADYGRVISCRLQKNTFFGIQIFESNRCAVINTSIKDSSVCLSLMASTELVLIHNAFFTGPATNRYCLAAEWYIEHHGPLDQFVPVYYAYNNLFHADAGGIPLVISLDVIKTLKKMDGNLYSVADSKLASLYYVVEGVRRDTYVTSMTEWRRVTTAEASSIFHRLGVDVVTDSTAGVVLDDSEGIFNRGLALDVVKSNLPSWFTGSILDDDADGNPRDDTPTPTPGPNESTTGDDYDVFVDFLGATSDLTVDDEDVIYGTDRAVRQLQLGVDCWQPNVAAGYFYVGDVAYYLYASKYGRTLRDFTWSRVELPSPMEIRSVGILDTSDCEDATPVRWFARGKTVWANHSGADLSEPLAESIRVYGLEQTWDSSEQAFHSTYVAREFSVRESPRDFFLDPDPQGGGPIVITDDTLLPESDVADRTDRSILPLEYCVRWDDDLQKTRLIVQGANNLFENPHFHVAESTQHGPAPVGWEFGNLKVECGSNTTDDTVVGRYRTSVFCTSETQEGQHALRQTVFKQDSDKDLVISWHVRSDSTMGLTPVVTTYYDNGEVFDEYELDTITPLDTSETSWRRYVIYCLAHPDSDIEDYLNSAMYAGSVDLRTVDNEISSKVRFELRAATLGTSHFDAMMASEGDYVQRYAGLEYEDYITVEYDSSDTGIHTVEDLSISPILNPQHSGFLTIGPVPMCILDTSVLETDHTTLSDTYLPGRLRGIPWAKIDGPNKLRGVASDVFSLESAGLPREVGLQPSVPTARLIEVFPNPVQVAQGLRASVHVKVTDSTNNPFAHNEITVSTDDEDGHYIGWLGLKEMGTVSQVGVAVATRTDPSGSVSFTFAAAEKLVIAEAFGTSELYPENSVPTTYKPSITNHANPTLYRAQTYEEISVVGSYTSELFDPTDEGKYLTKTLLRKPAFSTVELRVDGTSDLDVDLFESLTPDVADNEFYVDYATGKISYRNIRTGSGKVSYVPRLVWVDTSEPNALQFDDTLVDLITSDMIVQFDAESQLLVETGDLELEIPVILLNPDA